jgi:hypothetical protein
MSWYKEVIAKKEGNKEKNKVKGMATKPSVSASLVFLVPYE